MRPTLVLWAIALSACSSTTPEPSNPSSAEAPIDLATESAEPAKGCDANPAHCPGAPAPSWTLVDFQPKSEQKGSTYGLEAFRGKVTVVALLAGWCPYCQSQAQHLQKMQADLEGKGHEVAFLAINQKLRSDNDQDRQNLIDQCEFPLFQDTPEVDAWGKHGGGKDDIFVYGSDGTLQAFFPSDTMTTNLSKPSGYATLEQAVLAALK